MNRRGDTDLDVCLITGHYPPTVCGIADYTRGLAGGLTDLGLNVCVIGPEDRFDEPWPVLGVGDAWDRATFKSVTGLVRKLNRR